MVGSLVIYIYVVSIGESIKEMVVSGFTEIPIRDILYGVADV